MPLKRDDNGNRWVEMELVVPGTPEQVWRALATGQGNTAWFARTSIEERVGGTLHFDFGPNGESKGEVTVWQPPERLEYVERGWAENAPAVVTEVTVTARTGDRCLVRMVHSLFTSTDAWDDQLEDFEGGWPGFFEVLKLYLAHFADMDAASFLAKASTKVSHLETWKRLVHLLGLAGVDAGDRVTVTGAEELSGTVELVRQSDDERYIVLRLDEAAAGIALIGTYGSAEAGSASLALYLYGEQAEARANRGGSRWQDWLDMKFPEAT